MVIKIKKRDGRKVKFDESKISSVLQKVLLSVHPDDTLSSDELLMANNLTRDVILHIQERFQDDDIPSVEDIQDIVQNVLITAGMTHEAKNFIEYRTHRTAERELNSDLTKTYRKMLTSKATDMDLMRENANIDGNSVMGTMLRIGSEANKNFIDKYILKPEYSFAHSNGDFHIHDKDFYELTSNCLFVPVGKLLKDGFNTGHGFIRSPQSIQSASSLCAICIQSEQNDQFGGVGVATFDWDLAPYVAKSYANNILALIDSYADLSDEERKERKDEFSSLYDKHNTLFNDEAQKEIGQMIFYYLQDENLTKRVFEKARKRTERDVYQGMEALIHNLNSMHSRCLPADEEVVTKDGYKNINKINVGEYVLSYNTETQKYEYKKVKRVMDNGEKELLLLVLENGQRLRCTPDHKLYTSEGYVEAQDATDVLTKNGFTDIICKNDDITEEVYDIEVQDNHNFCVKDRTSNDFVVVHNCGAQVPFSSLNYGTNTTEEGRMIIRNVLLATEKGMGNGETPIFPVQIFKMKKGINFENGEPNYDLFELACKVSAKRLFPNFVYIDAPQNIQYYKEGRPETEMAAMGCRTRTISNVNGDSITVGRGNFSFTTLNLPRLGIDARGDWDKFFTKLDYMMDLAKEQLEARYELISRKHVYNFPFAYGQHCVYGSENLAPNDEIKEALKNYSISIGFIGLAECMVAMTGHHHGEGKQYYDQALKIIQHMRERTDRYTADTHMNWSLFATPAEGLSSRFTRIDKKRYGEIKGVTDRDYYTNSFHIPVYYDISAAKKMELEGPFHNLCNAGSITYVEANGDFTKNLEAFEDLVKYGLKCGLNYFAINHPVDSCPVCGYTGIIDDECPCCGFKDGDTEMDYDKLVELQRKGMLRNTVLREMSCGACHEQGETPE